MSERTTYSGRSRLPYGEKQLTRPRIDTMLDAALHHPLAVIVAGAGYGKTRAVANFLSHRSAKVIWLSLTDIDNFPLRFWQGFCAAIAHLNHELAAAIAHLGFPDSDIGFERFISLLSPELCNGQPVVVVMDDFHLINDRNVQTFVENLAKERLDGLRVFLLSREMPAFSATNLFLKNIMYFISQDDLRFTGEETRDYLALVSLPVNSALCDEIIIKSEGWISAIYLISLSLLQDPDGMQGSAGAAIGDRTGPNIFEMIDKEIYRRYDEQIQEFLLNISVLSSFEPELMKALSGRNIDPLVALPADNSFIRFDEHNKVYVIHHLLLAFLREKSSVSPKDSLNDTRHAAAHWYLEQGRPLEALEQYLAIPDYEALIDVIANRQEFYISRHYSGAVSRILDGIPGEVLEPLPLIRLAHINLMIDSGRLEEAYVTNEAIIVELENSGLSDEEKNACLGEAYLMRGFFSMDKIDETRSAWAVAHSLLPGGSVFFGPYAPFTFGNPGLLIMYQRRDYPLDDYMVAWHDGTDLYIKLSNGSGTGGHELIDAEICYFRRQFSKAEELAYAAIYQAQSMNQRDIEIAANFLLIRIAMAKGNPTKAGVMMSGLRKFPIEDDTLILHTQCDIIECWYYSVTGEPKRAPSWLFEGKLDNSNILQIGSGFEYLTHGRALLAQGLFSRLAGFAPSARELLAAKAFLLGETEAIVQYAIARYALGDEDEAVELLLEAIELSRRDGLMMQFAEYGRHLLPILRKVKGDDKYISQLRSACNTAAQYASRLITNYDKGNDGFSALTKREREVLSLIVEGLSRAEIAARLYIAPGTVKTLAASIYHKLDVRSAREAMRLASERGWTSDS